MAENDLRGIWRTRSGRTVKVEIRGISAQHSCRVYTGYDITKGNTSSSIAHYWDMDGKSLDYPDLDLMSRGVDSYGTLRF